MIVLKDVTKKYGRLTVLDRVSVRVEPGELLCLVGPSGAGKSTLLSVLVGAENVTSGSVSVDGVDLRNVPAGALQVFRRRIGIVYQDYKLLANRTVAENVAFPLEVCGESDRTIARRVPELLERMELTERAHAMPRELSGGEKARTAIARAIAHNPLILLADEPTQNLDPEQAKAVLHYFQTINKEEKTTIILATHDPHIVNNLHTRVLELHKGKVVRDNVGGYASHAKHGLLKEEKGNHDDKGHKKVRITAIHSD